MKQAGARATRQWFRGLGGQLFDTVDAAIKALGRQHADLDLHHVQPTGMLGDIVEFQRRSTRPACSEATKNSPQHRTAR